MKIPLFLNTMVAKSMSRSQGSSFLAIGSGEKPRLDWKVCLVCFFVLTTSLTVTAGVFYLSVTGADSTDSSAVLGKSFGKIDKQKLQKAEDFFSARDAVFTATKMKFPTRLDPSL